MKPTTRASTEATRRSGTMLCPDSRLRVELHSLAWEEFPREFYRLDTEQVARAIIGAWFVRRHQGHWFGARIVETEAYLGRSDRAAHSWQGRRTPRNEPMYSDGGHLYVFLVYGMHHCANVVTRQAGIAEAVLLRAAETPGREDPKLLRGPGKLCAALGITREHSGLDLLANGDLRLLKPLETTPNIGISKRIGVDYAGEAAGWPLRFFDRDSPAVSGPLRFRNNT